MATSQDVYSAVVGVDVGGTNTDAVLLSTTYGKPEILSSAKELTTCDIITGVKAALKTMLTNALENGKTFRVTQVNIGTNHFVNALVQRRHLAKVSLIRLCGTSSRVVPPFSDFPDGLRKVIQCNDFMVKGGYQFDRTQISNIDEDEIIQCVNEIQKSGVKHIVVAGVYSIICTDQEEKVKEIVLGNFPEASVTLSHNIGCVGLLERENASILNESLKGLCKESFQWFRNVLDDLGLNCPFFFTQNNGTIISEQNAIEYPIHMLASGPTNSMRGAAFLSGITDAIMVDIGGTTTDVGIMLNGFPKEASDVRIAETRINSYMPEILTFALGGGSYVVEQTDDIGTLKNVNIGPLSAGYNLHSECLVFGKDSTVRFLTTTDIAVAAKLAEIGNPDNVKYLDCRLVQLVIEKMRTMLESAIDHIKLSEHPLPVIVVGGGSCLIDASFPVRGSSITIIPPHSDVANAVGAALCQASGSVDYAVSIRDLANTYKRSNKKAKQIAMDQECEKAKHVAVQAGVDPETTKIVDKSRDILNFPGCLCRYKAKAVGKLLLTEDVNAMEIYQLPSADDAPECIKEKQTKTVEGNNIVADEPPTEVKPNIDEKAGEWILSEWDIECIIIGAGIQGSGGGGSPYIARLAALKAIRDGEKLRIITPERLMSNADPSRDMVLSVALMGSPDKFSEKLIAGSDAAGAVECLQDLYSVGCFKGTTIRNKKGIQIKKSEKITYINDYHPIIKNECAESMKIIALNCIEIGGGNCIVPLLTAAKMGVPVVDCDGTGRAVPELGMLGTFICGLQPYPAALVDDKNQRHVVLDIDNVEHLETHFRKIAVSMGGMAGIAFPPLHKKDVMDKTVMHSLSHTWRIGRTVLRSRLQNVSPVDAICKQENGKVLFIGKISDVTTKPNDGFTAGVLQINGIQKYYGSKLIIEFRNENLFARMLGENKALACTPDIISIVKSKTGEPISSEEVRYGMHVACIILPAPNSLRSTKALRLIGPSAFNHPEIKYTPVGEYVNEGPVGPL